MKVFSSLSIWGVLFSVSALPSAFASPTAEVLFNGQASETVTLSSRRILSNVTAEVQLDFSAVPEGVEANELFKVKLDGEKVDVTVNASGKLLIALLDREVRKESEGDGVRIVAHYAFDFRDLAPLNRAIETSFKKFLLKDGKLFFEASPDLFDLGLSLRLAVAKRRLFGQSRAIFNQPLPGASFSRNPTEDGKILYWADLLDLGLPELTHGSFEFSLSAVFSAPGEQILNASDLFREGRFSVSTHKRARKFMTERN